MCDTCGQLETISHKIFECQYSQNLWRALANLTGSNENINEPNYPIGAFESCDRTELTVHAEIIMRLIRKARPEIRPDNYLGTIIKTIAKKERGKIKTDLEALLR